MEQQNLSGNEEAPVVIRNSELQTLYTEGFISLGEARYWDQKAQTESGQGETKTGE